MYVCICVCGMVALSSLMCFYRQPRRLFYLVSDFANQERCYRDGCQNQSDSYIPLPSVTHALHLCVQYRPRKLCCNKRNDIIQCPSERAQSNFREQSPKHVITLLGPSASIFPLRIVKFAMDWIPYSESLLDYPPDNSNNQMKHIETDVKRNNNFDTTSEHVPPPAAHY